MIKLYFCPASFELTQEDIKEFNRMDGISYIDDYIGLPVDAEDGYIETVLLLVVEPMNDVFITTDFHSFLSLVDEFASSSMEDVESFHVFEFYEYSDAIYYLKVYYETD